MKGVMINYKSRCSPKLQYHSVSENNALFFIGNNLYTLKTYLNCSLRIVSVKEFNTLPTIIGVRDHLKNRISYCEWNCAFIL